MKQGERKEQILLAAIRMMSEKGYEPITLQMIADEVGIRPGSVYSHFQVKEDILNAILSYVKDIFHTRRYTREEILTELTAMTPEQFLIKNVMYYQDGDDTLRMQVYRLLFAELSNQRANDFAYHFFFSDAGEATKGIFETLAGCGAIPPTDTDALALVWQRTGAVFGLQSTHFYMNRPNNRYFDMIHFFIRCAQRGVQPIADRGECYTQCEQAYPHTGVSYLDPALPTKERLLYATYELMDEIGTDKITMRAISKKVGLQLNAIYNHYQNKDQLIEAVSAFIIDRAEIQVMDLKQGIANAFVSKNQADIIKAMSIFSPPLQNDEFRRGYRVLFKEQYRNPTLRNYYWDKLQTNIDALADVLDGLAAQGVIPPCEPREIATAYIYTMAAINIGSTMFPEDYSHMEEMRKMAGRWLLGLILGN